MNRNNVLLIKVVYTFHYHWKRNGLGRTEPSKQLKIHTINYTSVIIFSKGLEEDNTPL